MINVGEKEVSLFPSSSSPIPSSPVPLSARQLRSFTRVSYVFEDASWLERKECDARMHARTHACAAGRQAGTHACALLRDSSFLRATDAPIRGRVSFVIRENVNQSLLALALRWLSAPNLPRGSSSLFVFQRAALFGRSTLFVAFVADRFET